MILAVDNAFRNIGYSIWDKNDNLIKFGIIKRKKENIKFPYKMLEYTDGLIKSHESLKQLIIDNNIKLVFAELPGGSQNSRAATLLAFAQACISLTCHFLNVPIEYVNEGQVKQFLFNKRKVSKNEMMEFIRDKYKNINFPKTKSEMEHIADSIGVYLTLKNTSQLYKLIEK